MDENTRLRFAAATIRRDPRRRGSKAAHRRADDQAPPRSSPAQHHRLDVRTSPSSPSPSPSPARRRWPGAAPPHADLERRVHGGSLLGAFLASSSHQPSPPPQDREEESVPSAAEVAAAEWLRSFVDDIARSIVAPACLNPEAKESFPDNTRKLDGYLAAAKNLLQVLRHPAAAPGRRLHGRASSGDLHVRAASLLDTAMCALAAGFCSLRVWRDDALKGRTIASIWELARSSCRGNSAYSTSASSWPCSSGSFTGGSSGSSVAARSFEADYFVLGEETSVRSGEKSSDLASYIDHKSLSILGDIAGVMIEAGYEDKLRGAFDGHCTHLLRYIEILDIDSILGNHMEEPKELVLKVWTSATRIIIGVLGEMRRQLIEQDFGAFNALKEDYFSAIAKVSVMKLLNSAGSLCIQASQPDKPSWKDSHGGIKHNAAKMVSVVMMYQMLETATPTILLMCWGQTKDLILAKFDGLINGLSAMFLKVLGELNDLLRSEQLAIADTDVHCVTRHIMDHMVLLVEQKHSICLMLKGNQDEFGHIVTQLISSLVLMLEMNSRSLAPQGQNQMFLLNNVNFMLQQTNKYAELGLILGEIWFFQHQDKLDQFIAGYVEASWTPVILSFNKRTRIPTILWSHQLLDKFNSCFEMIYNSQKAWKVTDPLIRQKLRGAIAQKVIPLYRMQLENHSEKNQKSARYNVEQLEAQLMEMFEG